MLGLGCDRHSCLAAAARAHASILPKCEKVLRSVIAHQGFCDHFPRASNSPIAQTGKFHGIAFSGQDRIQNRQTADTSHFTSLSTW
jgi:hypothetical protein